jgi:uncharacterized protein (DUF3820 family)
MLKTKIEKINKNILEIEIHFGRYKGTKWGELSDDYLNFIISDDCHTYEINKDFAKKVLTEKKKCPGQVVLDFGV